MPKFQEHVTERLGARAHYPKLESCVYSAELPLVNAPMTWPRIGGIGGDLGFWQLLAVSR